VRAADRVTRLLRSFVQRGLLPDDDARATGHWQHDGGFAVDGSVRIEAAGRAGRERLLRYCTRPPFARTAMSRPRGPLSLSQRDKGRAIRGFHVPRAQYVGLGACSSPGGVWVAARRVRVSRLIPRTLRCFVTLSGSLFIQTPGFTRRHGRFPHLQWEQLAQATSCRT